MEHYTDSSSFTVGNRRPQCPVSPQATFRVTGEREDDCSQVKKCPETTNSSATNSLALLRRRRSYSMQAVSLKQMVAPAQGPASSTPRCELAHNVPNFFPPSLVLMLSCDLGTIELSRTCDRLRTEVGSCAPAELQCAMEQCSVGLQVGFKDTAVTSSRMLRRQATSSAILVMVGT